MASLKEQLEEQQGIVDEARQILEDAYTPEATRGDLVTAISKALDVLAPDDENEDEDEEDEDAD